MHYAEAAMSHARTHHDIIVIGASAGGLHVLKQLLAGLPGDLPAAILVVLHVGAESQLAHILDRVGSLPVVEAQNGAPIERGCVYVAAPGRHLLAHDDHILLRRGPRENLARPAIDPMFRSAAASFGGRVVGVVVSGALNDGTAGLHAVKRCGGLAVVQDPADAAVPDMPLSALRYVEIDHCVSSAELGTLLARLVRQPAGATPDIPVDIRLEAAIAAQEPADTAREDQLGKLSPFSCPECRGTLRELADGDLLRYRCHVGHAFTGEAVLDMQGADVEGLLSSLLRAHRERAELARRLAHEDYGGHLAAHLRKRARDYEDDAEVIRRLLLERGVVADRNSA